MLGDNFMMIAMVAAVQATSRLEMDCLIESYAKAGRPAEAQRAKTDEKMRKDVERLSKDGQI